MPAETALTSPDNPHVKAVVKLREHRARRATGLFVAEGGREVTRAVQAGLNAVELYRCPALLPDEPSALAAVHTKRFTVTESLFAKMAYNQNPEGLLGVFEQPRRSLDSLAETPVVLDELWLVAVGMAKPGNLGAMVRSAEAAGARGVLVADGVVDAFNPNAIRASTAAVFSLPVAGGTSEQVIDFLRRRGVTIYPAALGATTAHTDADMTGPTALVIGPEDAGLDARWLAAGRAVAIPMRGRLVDSLNASNAAAILLFEAVRQRSRGRKN